MIKFFLNGVNYKIQLCGPLCLLSEPLCNIILKSYTENHRETTEFHRGFQRNLFLSHLSYRSFSI